ncbi:MAG: CofH family radical SAM protein [Thermoguttaceae bacterium]
MKERFHKTNDTERMTLHLIEQKIADDELLSLEDGLFLFHKCDLHQLGKMATLIRRRFHGEKAYFTQSAHLNPTNICRLGCPLCAFGVKKDDPRAYLLDHKTIMRRVLSFVEQGATQIHLVSSVHPDLPYSWFRTILEMIHVTFPTLRLKAWTAVEINAFAESEKTDVETILNDLKSVGLSSLPGGGAEIFDMKIRNQISPKKISAAKWLDIHQTAHRLGIPTNASMLFGHIETPEDRISHLLMLQKAQKETGGFDSFVPLVFHSANTQIDVPSISVHEILKTIAISRIILSNIPHLKAYWVTLGESVAQIALSYGADDVEGPVFEERIHHEAGSKTPQTISIDRLMILVAEAGRVLTERSIE